MTHSPTPHFRNQSAFDPFSDSPFSDSPVSGPSYAEPPYSGSWRSAQSPSPWGIHAVRWYDEPPPRPAWWPRFADVPGFVPTTDESLKVLADLAASYTNTDHIVWGPTLIESVLSGDHPRHALLSREQRHHLIDTLRRLVLVTHSYFELESVWRDDTFAAIETMRYCFLEGALTTEQIRLHELLAAVLRFAGPVPEQLNDEPLEPRDVDLPAVQEGARPRLQRLSALAEEAVAALHVHDDVKVEVRAVATTLLQRAAENDPAMFSRKSRDDLFAAAPVRAALIYNGLHHQQRHALAALGIASASGNSRVDSVIRAARAPQGERPHGFTPDLEKRWSQYGELFCDPSLQISAVRRLLLDTADHVRVAIEAEAVAVVVEESGDDTYVGKPPERAENSFLLSATDNVAALRPREVRRSTQPDEQVDQGGPP